MQINVSPGVFWHDRSCLPCIKGTVKNRVEDFRVCEKPSRDSHLDPTLLSVTLPRVCSSDLILTAPSLSGPADGGELTIDAEEFMMATDCLAELGLLNEWIHQPEATEGLIKTKIFFDAPESKENRRLIYDYLKQRYPFVKTEKDKTPEGDGNGRRFVASADVSLLPLIRAGLPLADVLAVYLYLSRGPLSQEAARGLAVGRGLDRTQRTAVYKAMSKLCPLLDSKTLDDRETGVS
jgi:hypothetical protein